jgi:hypothetical protein
MMMSFGLTNAPV